MVKCGAGCGQVKRFEADCSDDYVSDATFGYQRNRPEKDKGIGRVT